LSGFWQSAGWVKSGVFVRQQHPTDYAKFIGFEVLSILPILFSDSSDLISKVQILKKYCFSTMDTDSDVDDITFPEKKVKGSKKKVDKADVSSKPSAKWTELERTTLVEGMVIEVQENNFTDSGFKNASWNAILNYFRSRLPGNSFLNYNLFIFNYK